MPVQFSVSTMEIVFVILFLQTDGLKMALVQLYILTFVYLFLSCGNFYHVYGNKRAFIRTFYTPCLDVTSQSE